MKSINFLLFIYCVFYAKFVWAPYIVNQVFFVIKRLLTAFSIKRSRSRRAKRALIKECQNKIMPNLPVQNNQTQLSFSFWHPFLFLSLLLLNGMNFIGHLFLLMFFFLFFFPFFEPLLFSPL